MEKTVVPAIHISMEDADNINIKVLRADRMTRHGFGTFLEKVQVGEITITKEAKAALLKQPYRSGLQGIEIFNGNIIAYGAPVLEIVVPLDAISLHKGAEEWFSECSIESEG